MNDTVIRLSKISYSCELVSSKILCYRDMRRLCSGADRAIWALCLLNVAPTTFVPSRTELLLGQSLKKSLGYQSLYISMSYIDLTVLGKVYRSVKLGQLPCDVREWLEIPTHILFGSLLHPLRLSRL